MLISKRLQYYRRVGRAYLWPGTSQLSFWHDSAALNHNASTHSLGEYYMTFSEKAQYAGPCDQSGIPMLNYPKMKNIAATLSSQRSGSAHT